MVDIHLGTKEDVLKYYKNRSEKEDKLLKELGGTIMENNIGEAKKPFKISELEQTSWAFKKLRKLQEEEDQIKYLASKEMEIINTWQSKELEKIENSKKYFNGILEEYYMEELEKNPKAKINTPFGKMSIRKQQPKWEIENEVALEWIKKNDKQLIRVKEEIDKAGLKKKYKIVGNQVVTEDGEIVEGIEILERDPKITIKVVE